MKVPRLLGRYHIFYSSRSSVVEYVFGLSRRISVMWVICSTESNIRNLSIDIFNWLFEEFQLQLTYHSEWITCNMKLNQRAWNFCRKSNNCIGLLSSKKEYRKFNVVWYIFPYIKSLLFDRWKEKVLSLKLLQGNVSITFKIAFELSVIAQLVI